MAYFDIQQYPILVVLIAWALALSAAHLLCTMTIGRIKFKKQSSKDVLTITVYTSICCILLSWSCIYLGQAKPMIEPK